MRIGAYLSLVVLCACGFREGKAGTDGAGSGSAVARAQQGVFAGAGRTTTGTLTVDVQVGAPIQVQKSTANTFTISGAPVIQP